MHIVLLYESFFLLLLFRSNTHPNHIPHMFLILKYNLTLSYQWIITLVTRIRRFIFNYTLFVDSFSIFALLATPSPFHCYNHSHLTCIFVLWIPTLRLYHRLNKINTKAAPFSPNHSTYQKQFILNHSERVIK